MEEKQKPKDTYFINGWVGLEKETGLPKSTLDVLVTRGLITPINLRPSSYSPKPVFSRAEVQDAVKFLLLEAQVKR